jgi:hypothetical protein
MRIRRLLCPPLAALAVVSCTATPPPSNVRRLYDLTPVSKTNPAVASVPDYGIEIPVSELRGFVGSSTPAGREGQPLSADEKRRELEKLVDDHLWMWQGYEKKADEKGEITSLLDITQTDAMRHVLLEEEAGKKANTQEEYERLSTALKQRLFEKQEVHLSATGYQVLRDAAKRLAEIEAGHIVGTADSGVTREALGQPFATSKVQTVTVQELLQSYTATAHDKRPNLEDQTALLAFVRDLMGKNLLLAEARERHLQDSDLVRRQVQADRNGLVRMWALDEVTSRAKAAMDAPDTPQRLREWYDSHLTTLYTTKDDKGMERRLSFEAEQELIRSDYFGDLLERLRAQELGKMKAAAKLRIDETVLSQTLLAWPAVRKPAQIADGDVLWDGVTREYVARKGEVSKTFEFGLTNLSPGDLVVKDVHPAVEYLTVKTPPLPWTLGPRGRGQIEANVDLRNKYGTGYATIEVETSKGSKTLTLKLSYPEAAPAAPRS